MLGFMAIGLGTLATAEAAAAQQGRGRLLELTLAFQENLGQAPAPVRFVARGRGYGILVTPKEVLLRVRDGEVLGLEPVGGSLVRLQGHDRRPGVSHHLRGDDPSLWMLDVPSYGSVRAEDVWPGIDMVLYGNKRQLEYDLVLAAGVDPGAARVRFRGAEHVGMAADGGLRLRVGGRTVEQRAPVAYQVVDGGERPVEVAHRVLEDGSVGFVVGSHDPALPLVIDPVISYGTYLGGSGLDRASAITADAAGNVYVTGTTASTDFPVAFPFQGALAGTYDVFVTKIAADGSLAWSTYLGGNGGYQDYENSYGICVDAAGAVVVTGRTNAADFPVRSAFQSAIGGGYDAFVTKLDAAGKLVWSTYLGGRGHENSTGSSVSYIGGALAMDGAGNVYVGGSTDSPDFPTVSPLQGASRGMRDAFLTKLGPSGNVLFSTYLGGSSSDLLHDIVVDRTGNAVYVAGATASPDFPTTPGAYGAATPAGFWSRIDPAGTTIQVSVVFDEAVSALGVDVQGGVYLAGETSSGCFPVTFGALQTGLTQHNPSYPGGEGWLAKFEASGADLVWATLYGQSNTSEVAADMAVDAFGHAYVLWVKTTGPHWLRTTTSAITKFDTQGTALSHELRLAADETIATSLFLDASGDAWIAGETTDTALPVTGNAAQGAYQGQRDGFVMRVTDELRGVAAVTVGTTKLTRTESTTGAVTLDGRAPPGGARVALAVQPGGAATVPASVIVPAGASTVTFPVQGVAGAAETPVTLTASYAGSGASAGFSVWFGPRYEVSYLQAPPGPGSAPVALGINNSGEATGWVTIPFAGYRYFLHSRAKGYVELGQGQGNAVNDRSWVVGLDGANAFVHVPGTGRRTLPLLPRTSSAEATDVNRLGYVVGSAFGNNIHAWLWTGGETSLDLGNLGAVGWTRALGINEKGQVVGESTTAGGWRHAFLWTLGGGMQDLGVLSGQSSSCAYDVNRRGEVCGISWSRAFLWSAGQGMRDLGPGLAHAIDEHGRVVGTSNGRAVMWTEPGGMQELRQLVSAEDAFVWPGMDEATDINDVGQIVGNGSTRLDGCRGAAFRLDPASFRAYGSGCAGTAGAVPVLAGSGLPAGGQTISFHVALGRPRAPAAILFGTERASVPLPGACSLLVGGVLVGIPAPIALDAEGAMKLDVPLPSAAGAGTVYMQVFIDDPASANGRFAASNGLEVRLL